MRNINLKLLTQREPVRLETSATTFGELKEEIVKAGVSIDFSNAQFIERVTKAEFGHIDSALLPPGDILLYVVPVKTKLGATDVDALSYKELRNYVVLLNKERGAKISFLGSKETMLKKVKEFLSEEKTESPVDKIKAMAESILEQVTLLKSYAKARNDVVYQVTLDDLDVEINELKKLLS